MAKAEKEKTNGALVVVEFQLPDASEGLSAQDMRDELDGLPADFFTRVKIPSGGGVAFDIPLDEDDPEVSKEIVGVIVDHHAANGYWKDVYNGQNNPPDCASLDGKFGEGNPGGDCSRCPLNEFGSGEGGKGKACKNMHRVFILREGEQFPLLLTLPPTSLKACGNYIAKQVVTKGRRSYGVLTKITLKKANSGEGIAYSQAVFSMAGFLSPEQTKAMGQYASGIKVLTRQVAVLDDEYIQNPDEYYNADDADEESIC